MPLFDTASEPGRMHIRLKALACAQDDIDTYGPIARSRHELASRVSYHLARLEQQKPTPQAELTDDVQHLTTLFGKHFTMSYLGLTVAYTGLQDPYRLTVKPRFTTSVNVDDSESEHPFFGLPGLLTILASEQAHRRATGSEECISLIQVSIHDQIEDALDEKTTRFVTYDVRSTDILGVQEKTVNIDDILQGLGLPYNETDGTLLAEGQYE